MRDVIFGLLAVAAGAALGFRGYVAMRIMIPMWGAFSGFALGAGIVAGVDDDEFLRSVGAWVVGVVVGAVFAGVAYLYFEISVAIAMAAVGFTLGTALMVTLGVRWSWLIVIVGAICGIVLAFAAIATDMPMLLLSMVTATAGAAAIVGGVMLVAGIVHSADFDSATTTERIEDSWWWYAIYVLLVVGGFAAQLADAGARRTMRQVWIDDGGRQLRRP